MGNEVDKSDEKYLQDIKDMFGVDVSKIRKGVSLLMLHSETGDVCLHYGPDAGLSDEDKMDMDTVGAVLTAFVHRLEHEPGFMEELLEYAEKHIDELPGVSLEAESGDWEPFAGDEADTIPDKKHMH